MAAEKTPSIISWHDRGIPRTQNLAVRVVFEWRERACSVAAAATTVVVVVVVQDTDNHHVETLKPLNPLKNWFWVIFAVSVSPGQT